MWFIGAVVGAFIGAVIGSMGRFDGAIAGLLVGAVAGAALLSRPRNAGGARLALMEDAIRQLNARIKTLEANASVPREIARDADAAPVVAQAPGAEVEAAAPATEWITLSSAQAPQPEAAEIAPQAAAASEPEAVAPAPVPVPQEPSALWQFLFGGNTLVRVGILVLFIGVAFLLKYAADQGLVPIEVRLAGVALGGIALLVVGWRLRVKREGYALMLQGGGVGVLYLTAFAALKQYQLIPPGLAFALLTGIAVFSAVLAVAQNSRALAITGVAGGFLAPILASTGGGNYVALFSFYAILNAGILFIAYFKAWRELNLVGFAFTAFIGLAWGMRDYTPDKFASVEPFLILFFVMYVAIAVLFALWQSVELTHYVDGTIVFGVPTVAFGMQVAMLRHVEFGAAWSALAAGAFYLVLASVLYAKKRESLRLLVESFLALGVGFATLAVPLAFEGRLTSAIWAVEGAAIVWVGVRQNRRLARWFGVALQVAAGVAFLHKSYLPSDQLLPLLNSVYLGGVMVSLAGLFCSGYMERHRERIDAFELVAARFLFVWGALWWFAAGASEINRHLAGKAEWNAHLLFVAASCAAFCALWQRLNWSMARFAALAILPLMTVIAFAIGALEYGVNRHPFAGYALIGWVAAFAVHFWVLRRHEGAGDKALMTWFHAAGFWLLTIVASWEVGWQIDHYVEGRRVWPLIAWAVVPGALIAIFAARGERLGWPVAVHRYAYVYLGALPVAVFLLLWIVAANFISNGDPAPLPYVPIINPLDLAQFGALLALAIWYVRVKGLAIPRVALPSTQTALTVLGIVLFIALNGVLLRTLHHYADVPFRFNRMMSSTLVQASFSLFWSLLALAAMFFANKRGLRALWFVGAALLAVVIAKLALVDLSNTGTVERIVSFIGVGLFCVVIGYFAPVPPKAKAAAKAMEAI